MNRKTIVMGIVAALLLLAAIIAAVTGLYSGDGWKDSHAVGYDGDLGLLEAVPSDAALIASFKDSDRMGRLLRDTCSALMAALTDPEDPSMRDFLGEGMGLRGLPSVLSLHYSGSLLPLVILDAGAASADTSAAVTHLMTRAADKGLNYKYIHGDSHAGGIHRRNILLVSRSETIVNSSARHLSEGISVIESDGFPGILSRTGTDNAIFISHRYADKFLGKYVTKGYRKYSKFFTSLGGWSGLRLTDFSESGHAFKGEIIGSDTPGHWPSVLQSSETAVAQMLPANTDFAVSVPVAEAASYVEAWKRHLDAGGRPEALKKEEAWAVGGGIREAAVAWLHVGKELLPAVLVRFASKRDSAGIVMTYDKGGYAAALFGGAFSLPDESCAVNIGEWTVSGSRTVVTAFADEAFRTPSLREFLSELGLSGAASSKCGAFAYYSLSEDPSLIDKVFRTDMAQALRRVIKGVSDVPFVLTLSREDDGAVRVDATLSRSNLARTTAVAIERDTVVTVPTGPFEVTNSGTGEKNLLLQQPNMYLVLQDADGKGIWGIPFKAPLCGRVQTIDYYNNGKLQFLFASGSQLWLLDRLGRFVKGFPAELGKDVLLGPDVYDFTGAKGWRAMVLHKDNTLGLYNLHGQKAEGWKGISCDETIKGLPELVEAKGKRYWVVRTSMQTLLYPFEGGETLTKFDGQKRIRPDSKVEVAGNGSVRVTCLDGKERNVKL